MKSFNKWLKSGKKGMYVNLSEKKNELCLKFHMCTFHFFLKKTYCNFPLFGFLKVRLPHITIAEYAALLKTKRHCSRELFLMYALIPYNILMYYLNCIFFFFSQVLPTPQKKLKVNNSNNKATPQPAFNCSKLKIETPEQV